MIETTSTCVHGIDFRLAPGAGPARGTLTLQLPGGRLYAYDGVPESLVKRLLWAESRGRFFAQHIRPRFQGRRVEG